MTDFNTASVKQTFDIPEGQRKPDVEHHRKADDLRARFEVLEGERLVII